MYQPCISEPREDDYAGNPAFFGAPQKNHGRCEHGILSTQKRPQRLLSFSDPTMNSWRVAQVLYTLQLEKSKIFSLWIWSQGRSKQDSGHGNAVTFSMFKPTITLWMWSRPTDFECQSGILSGIFIRHIFCQSICHSSGIFGAAVDHCFRSSQHGDMDPLRPSPGNEKKNNWGFPDMGVTPKTDVL